ncbi:class I mannose-6-phosphate isomerase [Sphingomonas sp.]|uniref:class I mannose-6-phosphate isomerase n=1 Tax=Sphingomonas sp. TaxID=28214 RepID=UPI0025CFCE13|nr:class I mannose-6-phosphate isomerase [Sphingomonas sp.]
MQRLATRIVDKPWGRKGIDPRFHVDPKRQVGEIWFEPPADRPLDVMVKYLFTTERLSVQVHPDDIAAHERGHARGKDECWIILDADKDAELGIGTVRDLSPDEVMAAARDGSIVDLIDWRRPRAGDFIYNPAGTIHAIGPGLTVLEIQQAIDLTYRLYDYGRPRKLHPEEAVDVVRAMPHHHALDTHVGEQSRVLVGGPHFGVAWCAGAAPELPLLIRDVQLLPIDAPVGELKPGECALIDSGTARSLTSEGRFVLAWSTETRGS